eukprot:jgi/Botrbrau1/8817/Bobra.0335s0007.1
MSLSGSACIRRTWPGVRPVRQWNHPRRHSAKPAASAAPGTYKIHRKLLGAETVDPDSLSSVQEALERMGYGGGVSLSYRETSSIAVPRHSHDTRSVEFVVEGAFHYTFPDGKEETLHPGDGVELGKDTEHQVVANGEVTTLICVTAEKPFSEMEVTWHDSTPDPEAFSKVSATPFPSPPVEASA